jgi:hypothetical protein
LNSPALGSVGCDGAREVGCCVVRDLAPLTPWPGSVTDGVTALPEDAGALVPLLPSPAEVVGWVVGAGSPRSAAAVRWRIESPVAAPRVDDADEPLVKFAEHPGWGVTA